MKIYDYKYSGVDGAGNKVKGTMSAPSESVCQKYFVDKGYMIK